MLVNAWAERAGRAERDGRDGPAEEADRADPATTRSAAAESASAPAGFRLAVKATLAVAGAALSAGCPVFADATADVDASLVAALRRRGGRVVGTTNCHELAFGITGANSWLGTCAHPSHPDRSAGGSSGGSAAVVAAGEADLAVGTDTGGSVSIPASVCGVVASVPRWAATRRTASCA